MFGDTTMGLAFAALDKEIRNHAAPYIPATEDPRPEPPAFDLSEFA